MIFSVHIIWVLPHSDIKFEGKIFENICKIDAEGLKNEDDPKVGKEK